MALEIGSGITIGRGIGVSMTPTITVNTEPSSVISYQGQTATFTISASVDFNAVLSYQWAKLEAQGGSWANILGATSSSYTTGTLTVASDNGDKYRCILSATRGAPQVTSNSGTLTVEQSVITINTQPQNQTVVAGNTATFSVSASVTLSATLSYQWYVKYRGDTFWSTITAATSSSYTTWTISEGDAAEYFRVIVSATKGATPVTSDSASLTILVNNTMTVAEYFDGISTYTGASKGNRINAFGTLTSDYFEAIYTYNGGGEVNSFIFLTPGTYPNFTVSANGQINDDPPSYPRYFAIDNVQYTMVYDASNDAYTMNSSLSITNGTTVPVSCNGSAPSLTSNTIICASYIGGSFVSYGASTGVTSTGGFYNSVYGTVVSDYFLEVSTFANLGSSSYSSVIRLKDGSYSGFSVTNNGAIGTDGNGATRIFTINSTNYTFTGTGAGSSQYQYTMSSEITAFTTGVGQAFPVIYDPNAQGGGGDNTAVGTMTVGYMGGRYGWQSGAGYGSASISPSMVAWIYYDQVDSQTRVQFINGTYGSVIVDSTSVDGQTSVTVTIGPVTETTTLTSGSGLGPTALFSGDVFNLQGQNYQTLPVEILAGTGGGGGGGTTYTGGIDYQDNPGQGQVGIFFGNPPGGDRVFVNSSSWTTPAGAAALLALSNGSTFTVSAFPAAGGAPVTSTITLTGNWDTNYGGPSVTITSSPQVSVNYPDPAAVPLSVTIGGGSAGTEVILRFGFWGGGGPGTDLYLSVYATNTAGIAAMDAVPANSTITLNDPTTSPSTIQVTLSGSFSKFGPSGPPGQEAYGYIGTTTAVNSDPSKYQNIASVTVPGSGGGGGSTQTFNQAGNWTSAYWQYGGMGTGRLTLNLDSNPNSSFLSAINAVSTSGTTVTMTDAVYGTSSPVSITGIGSGATPKPWGSFSSAVFSLASYIGTDWNNIVTIALTTSSGPTNTIANLTNVFWQGLDVMSQGTLYTNYATSTDRDAAYTKLNAPGTWNVQGNYFATNGGSPSYGTYQMQLAGPSSTDDTGPPGMMYRVLSPSFISNIVYSGPATGGPFSISK